MFLELGLNIISFLILFFIVLKLKIIKDNFAIYHKIIFITMNVHQILSCLYFVIIYFLSFFNISKEFICMSTEFLIISLFLKIIYEYLLTVNPDRSVTEYLIKYDLSLLYKISTFGTILILYVFGSELQCLNEMTNVLVMAVGSFYDINMLLNYEYVMLGTDGNNTKLNQFCKFLGTYLIKIYLLSTIIDTTLVIYYKFFTKRFAFFFFYKVFTFITIVIKIYRVAMCYDPSVPDFESASIKHLKKWIRNDL